MLYRGVIRCESVKTTYLENAALNLALELEHTLLACAIDFHITLLVYIR